MINIYYDPAELGYELVGVLDEADLSYEFNMLAVWRKLDDGTMWYAQDSGCSCPSPFEDTGVGDLEPVSFDRGGFFRAVTDFPATPTEKTSMLALVRRESFGAHVFVNGHAAFM